jgi:hypothetical protein
MEQLISNPDIMVAKIVLPTRQFLTKFGGYYGSFFKEIKNSLQSLDGIPNRTFFRSLTGAYFSLMQPEFTEIYLAYDTGYTRINTISLRIRLKKIAGHNSIVETGKIEDFEASINQIVNIDRKVQVFGKLYKS